MGNTPLLNRLAVGGLVLIVVAAGLWIGKLATAPHETIKDFQKIPPKGAGRYDRS